METPTLDEILEHLGQNESDHYNNLGWIKETVVAELAMLKEKIEILENRLLNARQEEKFEHGKALAAEERLEKLENDLISAPNPYLDSFQLSKYKGWYVTDRTNNLPIKKKNKKNKKEYEAGK